VTRIHSDVKPTRKVATVRLSDLSEGHGQGVVRTALANSPLLLPERLSLGGVISPQGFWSVSSKKKERDPEVSSRH